MVTDGNFSKVRNHAYDLPYALTCVVLLELKTLHDNPRARVRCELDHNQHANVRSAKG